MNLTATAAPKPRMRYTSPWNMATLGVGIALLIAGSFYYQAPDWDIPISLIMAGFAYLRRRGHCRSSCFARGACGP
jgi:hypothetical protein